MIEKIIFIFINDNHDKLLRTRFSVFNITTVQGTMAANVPTYLHYNKLLWETKYLITLCTMRNSKKKKYFKPKCNAYMHITCTNRRTRTYNKNDRVKKI